MLRVEILILNSCIVLKWTLHVFIRKAHALGENRHVIYHFPPKFPISPRFYPCSCQIYILLQYTKFTLKEKQTHNGLMSLKTHVDLPNPMLLKNYK